MASIRALLSSSSLRRCMFSRSCRASLNDCKKVSKIPKNSSGCILPSSSPKCFRELVNCTQITNIIFVCRYEVTKILPVNSFFEKNMDISETYTKTKCSVLSAMTKIYHNFTCEPAYACICMNSHTHTHTRHRHTVVRKTT